MSSALTPGTALDFTRPCKLTIERVVYSSAQTNRSLYRVHNSHDGLSYALKAIPTNDASALEAIRRETVALNRQNQHPDCLPRYRGCWSADGFAYLLLDWMEGVPLAELSRGQPVRSEEDARIRLDFMVEACQSVAHLHRNGFKHRDLKPENLLARDPNRPDRGVAVIDLGLSTLPRTDEEGTRGYHAPEQYGMRNQNLTTAADVFALAQTTWYLLTGGVRQPIQAEGKDAWYSLGPSAKDLIGPVPLPDEVETVLDSAFAFRPEQRPAHAAAFGALLRNAYRARRR